MFSSFFYDRLSVMPSCWSFTLAALSVLIIQGMTSLAFAQELSEKTPQEEWKKEIGEDVNTLANRIDSYFGQTRADDERSGSTLRLAPQLQVGEFMTPQTSVDLRLNLHLRNLEQFGHEIGDKLFGLNSDPSDDPTGSKPSGTSKSNREEWNWTKSIETHAAGLAPPTYGVLVRVRKNYPGKRKWIHRFWWSIGWDNDLLWENNANFSSDYAIGKNLLFRWFNQWTYNMSSSLQTTSQGPSFYQTVSDHLSVSYDARMNMAVEAGAWVLDNYSFGSTIRRRLKNRWIFLEVDPVVDFGRSHFFQRQLSVLAKVEFVFGDI